MHILDLLLSSAMCEWNPTTCGDIDTIENVQRVFTRREFKRCLLPRLEYCDRLVVLYRYSLERRRFVNCVMYSIFKKLVACNVLSHLTSSISWN
jgi:hypothetical protein